MKTFLNKILVLIFDLTVSYVVVELLKAGLKSLIAISFQYNPLEQFVLVLSKKRKVMTAAEIMLVSLVQAT